MKIKFRYIPLILLSLIVLISCNSSKKKEISSPIFLHSAEEFSKIIQADSIKTWAKIIERENTSAENKIRTLGFEIYFSKDKNQFDKQMELFKNQVHKEIKNINNYDFLETDYYNNGELVVEENEQLNLFL